MFDGAYYETCNNEAGGKGDHAVTKNLKEDSMSVLPSKKGFDATEHTCTRRADMKIL